MLHFIHSICEAGPYTGQDVRYLHAKHDGIRITALKQPKACKQEMAFLTRNSTDYFPEIYARAKQHNIWPWVVDLLKVEQRTSVDGELFVPGEPASYVKTAIKTNDPALKFVAFAVPWENGQRCYHEPLDWAMDFCTIHHIEFADFIDIEDTAPIDPEKALKRADPATEGWVLKRHHYAGWWKLKRQKTLEVIITGVTEGKGKYEGLIGGLRGSVYGNKGELIEICICSGMTDEERVYMSNNSVKGLVAEVKYQEVLSLGRLRHPNFVRFRPDKIPSQCTIAQDPVLLKHWG